MVETTEKEFTKAIQELFKEWEKTKDKETLRIINSLQKSKRSLQSSKMQDRLQQQVRGNIERRAELQKGTSAQFPNIAQIMTGGAPSPVSLMGRMQRQASKPFKRVWDYQQSGESMKELGAKWIKGGRKDDEMRNELEKMGAEHSGKGKRAEAGFGKNLMGKKMQGMIGKVGKFMESSKGQGLMAGGMMGASILTMIIKKAMEASPMLQQMLKIMNVAMTLFLRPIGDFIGGMLKPIMLFFLREVAVPMLRKGKDMIKIGEQFGKGALGFMLKPIETIREALNPFSSSFDGIKEWMTEQKLRGLAAEMEGRELLTVLNIIKNKAAEDKTVGADPFTGAPGYTTTHAKDYNDLKNLFGGPEGFLTQFENIMYQGQAHGGRMSYEYASGYFDNMKDGGGVAAGMGGGTGFMAEVAPVFTEISTEGSKVTTAFVSLSESANWVAQQYRLKAMEGGMTDEQIAASKALFDEFRKSSLAGMMGNEQTLLWNEFQEKLQTILYPVEKAEKELSGTVTHIARGSRTIEELFKQIEGDFFANRNTSEHITTDFIGMADLTLQGYKKVQALLAQLAAAGNRYYNSRNIMVGRGGGLATWTRVGEGKWKSPQNLPLSSQAAAYYKNLGVNVRQFAHGGVIGEHIWGIGESGKAYEFGEKGSELVTPLNKAKEVGNTIANITVNIDKVASDVDLEQIKPIVERALHEVHSRRGMI